jgi:hypothetical protein
MIPNKPLESAILLGTIWKPHKFLTSANICNCCLTINYSVSTKIGTVHCSPYTKEVDTMSLENERATKAAKCTVKKWTVLFFF